MDYCKNNITGGILLTFTLDFISSFQKHRIILFLQFGDVAKSLVQDHILTLEISKEL